MLMAAPAIGAMPRKPICDRISPEPETKGGGEGEGNGGGGHGRSLSPKCSVGDTSMPSFSA